MSEGDSWTDCLLCQTGHVVKRIEELAFRQWTDKGYVHCRVTIPIGTCDTCGARTWDQAGENVIEEAVRREYDKLP